MPEQVEGRKGKDPGVHGRGERGRRQGEVDPRKPQRRQRHEDADQGAHPDHGQQGERIASGPQMAHDDGSDTGECHLAQREPPGVANDGHQGQADDGEPPDPVEAEEVGLRDDGRQHEGSGYDTDGEVAGPLPAWDERELAAAQQPVPTQSGLREEQERSEQDDGGNRTLEPLDIRILG